MIQSRNPEISFSLSSPEWHMAYEARYLIYRQSMKSGVFASSESDGNSARLREASRLESHISSE